MKNLFFMRRRPGGDGGGGNLCKLGKKQRRKQPPSVTTRGHGPMAASFPRIRGFGCGQRPFSLSAIHGRYHRSSRQKSQTAENQAKRQAGSGGRGGGRRGRRGREAGAGMASGECLGSSLGACPRTDRGEGMLAAKGVGSRFRHDAGWHDRSFSGRNRLPTPFGNARRKLWGWAGVIPSGPKVQPFAQRRAKPWNRVDAAEPRPISSIDPSAQPANRSPGGGGDRRAAGALDGRSMRVDPPARAPPFAAGIDATFGAVLASFRAGRRSSHSPSEGRSPGNGSTPRNLSPFHQLIHRPNGPTVRRAAAANGRAVGALRPLTRSTPHKNARRTHRATQ